MKFRELADYLEKLEKLAGRLEMTEILVELIKRLSIDEIDLGVYLMLGGLGSDYQRVEFNMADKMVMRAIARVAEKEVAEVGKWYRKRGDLGTVVKEMGIGKERGLELKEVYQRLKEIAEDEGRESQERKVEGLASLLGELRPGSGKFVVRIVLGKLRLGFSAKTVLEALSVFAVGDKGVKTRLERAYQVLPDVGLLGKRVKREGLERAVKRVDPVLGVPVSPMLCQRLKSPKEMIAKMGRVAVEPKFDGTRVGIHFKRGESGFVRTFTRNLKETSFMFPELLEMGKWVKARELILDTEAVGLDEERKMLASFQKTMRRRRKHKVADFAVKVPVKFCVFDVLFKDGKNLMDLAYFKRRKILERVVTEGKLFQVDEYKATEDPGVIAEFHQRLLDKGLEGVIVKGLESKYVPGRTGWRWVKMKEVEKAVAKLSDTLDCVVMGYSAGQGKRAGFGIGKFLVGVRKGEKILTVAKIGTGLTDKQFRQLKRRLDTLVVKDRPLGYVVDKGLEPDVWVEEKLVVEVAADEITKSPIHSAGVALRFPRLVRFRDDKDISGVTTLAEVKRIRR